MQSVKPWLTGCDNPENKKTGFWLELFTLGFSDVFSLLFTLSDADFEKREPELPEALMTADADVFDDIATDDARLMR
jgi:hypothetical protein